MNDLFEEQVKHLDEGHFLVLYWAAQAEGEKQTYNITNCFDDLKFSGITRTRQTAMITVLSLAALRFIELRESGTRKHIYISKYGAQALQSLVLKNSFTPKPSVYLERQGL